MRFNSAAVVAIATVLAVAAPVFAVPAGDTMDQVPTMDRRAACKVTVSQKIVHSESKPRGKIRAIVVTGADDGATPGGVATAEERCAYFYGPDIKQKSSKPLYAGSNWPYIKVGAGCEVVIDASVPVGSKVRSAGFVSVQAGTRVLLFGGLPVYQYDDDEVGACFCNQPPEWTSFNAQGTGAAFPVTY